MTAPRQRYCAKTSKTGRNGGGELQLTPTFPLRNVTPLRVALQEPRCTNAIYKAAWVDGHNIGEPEVLKRVLDKAGFDGPALLEGTQDPDIKSQLFSNTEEAIARNVCGVPSLIVNHNILFWGQDRLSMVEGALWVGCPKSKPAAQRNISDYLRFGVAPSATWPPEE